MTSLSAWFTGRLAGIGPKIVAGRIGHASMAYIFAIYTHKSTGKKTWPGCCSALGGRAPGAGPLTSAPHPSTAYAQTASELLLSFRVSPASGSIESHDRAPVAYDDEMPVTYLNFATIRMHNIFRTVARSDNNRHL